MTTIPNIEIKAGGSFAIPAIGYRDNILLAAGVAQTITLPVDSTTGQTAKMALFAGASGVDFYAAYTPVGGSTVTAIVPGATVSDGTGMDENPAQRTLSNVSKISLISASACVVTITFYV